MKSLFITLLLIPMALGNPFKNPFYVHPTYTQNVETTIKQVTDSSIVQTLKIAQGVGSAYWIDTKSKITAPLPNTNTLDGILNDASKKTPAPLIVFITYNLPNRDCNAFASNGEICCNDKLPNGQCAYEKQDCSQGLTEYKTQYIDKIVAVVKKYPKVPTVTVIEPDSLPNLVTNGGNARCKASVTSYKEGIKYAVEQYAKHTPHVYMYVDAAHGGWLGWEQNLRGFVSIINEIGILPSIRGFATNVANYQPLGVECPTTSYCLPANPSNLQHECCKDPCGLTSQWNPSPSEIAYVQNLKFFFPTKFFIIDTGRNGHPEGRKCASWCNPRNMGFGHYPTSQTGYPHIDAFFWLKTPGESDGCSSVLPSGERCVRFDYMCDSPDSLGTRVEEPKAPEAGRWYPYQIIMYAKNADFKIQPQPQPQPQPQLGYWKCKQCTKV